MPVLLGREISIRAGEIARAQNGFAFLVLQRDLEQDELTEPEDLHRVAVVARIQNLTPLPNGFAKVLMEGLLVVELDQLHLHEDKYWVAHGLPIQFKVGRLEETNAMRSVMVDLFQRYADYTSEVPAGMVENLKTLDHPVDAVLAMLPFVKASLQEKQKILEANSFKQTCALLTEWMEAALQAQGVQRRVEQDVRHRLQQNQKEWFLHEQIRLLQEELGEDGMSPEISRLAQKIRDKKFPQNIQEKVQEEFERLPHLHPSTPEYAVVRNYIDTFLSLPFHDYTQDELNLRKVRQELDRNHFGLEKVKQRILEHVAILKLTGSEKRTPILCLVGPPGVGKTSLTRSIADSMNRHFVRLTLGGVRDEAEIRGHRRTYIGSMPGRIIQSLKKSKVMNPLILLDEIDKMSSDFRGDPASAMLEVLDPEQNHDFTDHFLETGVDLSRVLFVATANQEELIPAPLRDRMEIVRLSSYHRHEKLEIAKRHLLNKVMERNGIPQGKFEVLPETLEGILEEYTREAGVRELERELDALARKRAMEIVAKKRYVPVIERKQLSKYLGIPKYKANRLAEVDRPGVISGLAYTPVGGEILLIECTLLSGKGRLQLTGTLGDVMKESAQIALTLVRERSQRFGLDPQIFRQTDIHIHVPEGAVPKDGPSAGIALTLALLSAFTRQKVPARIAFTGEVSLTGQLHAIGGLTEKAIAALEAGVTDLYLPRENQKNASDLPVMVRKGLKIHLKNHIDEIIKALFQPVQHPQKKPEKTSSKS